MFTVTCKCGHPIYDHASTVKPNGVTYHNGPCSKPECPCQHFDLDRSRTRYETEHERLIRQRNREVFA